MDGTPDLPMLGLTHGSRNPVTCHLKCGSACAYPAPNESTAEPTFREIAGARLSRRSFLLASGALAAGVVGAGLRPGAVQPAAAVDGRQLWPQTSTSTLPFTAITPPKAARDGLTVPKGYRWTTILRWGDPLFDDSPAFNPGKPSAKAQRRQFGYNNDYLDIIVTDNAGTEALLCCNHEYTNREIMFAPRTSRKRELEIRRTLMAAHGFSIVELRRAAAGTPWKPVRGGRRNRRITASTVFRLTGPAAGSSLVTTAADPGGTEVRGTLANCAGGTTPWGTILSGEENFHNYFVADLQARGSRRYGMRSTSVYKFETVDKRFRATAKGYRNEPHRFGWIVEIDPTDPTSTPRKHTALGRFKHEAATIRVDDAGRVSAYMGDDEKFEYLYKFVARDTFDAGGTPAARAHNLSLLTEGDLYVARFSGPMQNDNANLGTGRWLPLTRNGRSAVPGMSLEEVLVFTREAADQVRATPMDRCEDVQPSPVTGKIYVACTKNADRGTAHRRAADAANPRSVNKDGHVIEIAEAEGRSDAGWFAWNLLLVCGDPDTAGTYFAGWTGPVTPIACPDNLAFDSAGDMWIATDGAPEALGHADGLFHVPLQGRERGRVRQFLAVPQGAETCGPVIHDQDGSVFVSVQHPGEGGTWNKPQSYFPDFLQAGTGARKGAWRGPRPSVVQVSRTD